MFPINEHNNLALLTDLYELTMAAGYFECGLGKEIGTFELFIRDLPPNRGYLVAAGLETALRYLEGFCFLPDEIAYLRSLPVFSSVSDRFFEALHALRFTGEVWAIPEGSVVFPGEPLLRVTAPIIEAQIVETYLLSMINAQTMIATKAARVVQAAKGRKVIDFGSRRAHGPGAGVLAARTSYIGGCVGTSNVYAGFTMGIPVFGTHAHSWVLAFSSEEEAFRQFHQKFPESTTLLIDTFDTIEGARRAAAMGPGIGGVRLDSGNLEVLSREVRKILDEAGLSHVKIVASGDLNEYRIEDLVCRGAPIDIFGVGTEMVTSKDVPAVPGVYKLVEKIVNGEVKPVAKFSLDKISWPGRKQVFRCFGKSGNFH